MFFRRLFAAALLLVSGCHRGETQPAAPPPLPVTLATVMRGDVASTLTVRGVFAPSPGGDVRLGALASGRLAELDVAEGDRVVKGQLLARLEPTTFRDAQAQAEAAVSQAKAQAVNAQGRLARADLALDAGVAARQEVDDAQAQRSAAEGSLRAAQAGLSTASNQLGRTELRAPFDGAVVHVFAAAGEPIDGPGHPILEVADTRTLELRGTVAPSASARVSSGDKAIVMVEALGGGGLAGEVAAVAPAVDAVTGGVLVRVRVDNSDGRIKAGEIGSAAIAGVVGHGVLRIPEGALVSDDDDEGPHPAVERIEGASGAVKRERVALGISGGGFAEVRSGVAEGDRIVVGGGYGLPDGTRVREEASGGPGDAGLPAVRP